MLYFLQELQIFVRGCLDTHKIYICKHKHLECNKMIEKLQIKPGKKKSCGDLSPNSIWAAILVTEFTARFDWEVLDMWFVVAEADSHLEENVSEQKDNVEENSDSEGEEQVAREKVMSKNNGAHFHIKLEAGWQCKMPFEWFWDPQDTNMEGIKWFGQEQKTMACKGPDARLLLVCEYWDGKFVPPLPWKCFVPNVIRDATSAMHKRTATWGLQMWEMHKSPTPARIPLIWPLS